LKFAVIIPDRNDRPELTSFCFKQLERMTLQPEEVYHVNYRPNTVGYDLVDRVMYGVAAAKEDGVDICFMIENDDYYPADYFEKYAPYFEEYDFFGQEHSTYYNLKNLSYNTFTHPYRSSLFTTGFKLSALNNFDYPPSDKPFLDIELWKYGRHKRRKFVETGAVGIKHGLGLCGGKGHKMNMQNKDPKMSWLSSAVDIEAFEFYKSMVEKLTAQPA
jgi:hypothetical protein